MKSSLAQPPEGILLFDKPSGYTSHDMVDKIRRQFQIKKVGHAGTLDPIATGLLILLIGKATKISQYLISLSKEYEGTFKLGITTDSHDADGQVVEEKPVPEELDTPKISEAMKQFVGDQHQIPPMFSAKKHKGKPLYKTARKGGEVEREARFIHISHFDINGLERPDVHFRVSCSKGTYVRTLIHDLGQSLGCGANMTALRRTAVDRFRIEKAITLEQLEEMNLSTLQQHLIPPYQAVPSHVLR